MPPSFAVANPARIAFDFPNTVNALGRSNQDIGQGDLRSMNVVQAANRTRLVLNLRRNRTDTQALDGKHAGRSRCRRARRWRQTRPAAGVPRFAEGRPATPSTTMRDVDFRRGRGGEGRVVVDLSDTTTGIDIRPQGQNIVVDFLKTTLPENLRRRLDVVDFAHAGQHRRHVPAGRERAHGDRAARASGSTTAYQPDTQFVARGEAGQGRPEPPRAERSAAGLHRREALAQLPERRSARGAAT